MAASKKSNHKRDAAGNGRRAATYTIGLVVLAFAVIAASSFLLPSFGVGGRPPPGSDFDVPPRGLAVFDERISFEAYNYFLLRFAFAAINVCLLVYLLFIYVKDYMRLKAKFTLGIIAFLFSFLLYALSSLPLVHIMLGPYGRGIFSFVPMLFSAIGLLIFARLSNE